jgi:hypothetical protein
MFIKRFRAAWDANTVYFDPNAVISEEELFEVGQAESVDGWEEHELAHANGIRFDVENRWSGVHDGLVWFYAGCPYRKDIRVDDSLNSYQVVRFRIGPNGEIIIEDNGDGYFDVAWLKLEEDDAPFSLRFLAESKVDIFAQGKTPEELVNGFFDEIGLMY